MHVGTVTGSLSLKQSRHGLIIDSCPHACTWRFRILGSRSEVPPGLWPLLQPRKLSFLEHEPTTAQLVESKEYDSALVLVEATALEALKYAEKNSIDPGAISKPMLSFLQQVCVEAPSFNPSIEHRRLEFLSSCSPFFKHWSEEVLRDALTRILAPIRSPHPEAHKAQQKGIKLEQRALSHFRVRLQVGRSPCQPAGGTNRPKLKGRPTVLAEISTLSRMLTELVPEALNQECMQLAGSVSSAHARGQLIEALALALASCPDLDTWIASYHTRCRQFGYLA